MALKHIFSIYQTLKHNPAHPQTTSEHQNLNVMFFLCLHERDQLYTNGVEPGFMLDALEKHLYMLKDSSYMAQWDTKCVNNL